MNKLTSNSLPVYKYNVTMKNLISRQNFLLLYYFLYRVFKQNLILAKTFIHILLPNLNYKLKKFIFID